MCESEHTAPPGLRRDASAPDHQVAGHMPYCVLDTCLCRDLVAQEDYRQAFADAGVVTPLCGLLEGPLDPSTQVATEALTVLASSAPIRIQIRCVCSQAATHGLLALCTDLQRALMTLL